MKTLLHDLSHGCAITVTLRKVIQVDSKTGIVERPLNKADIAELFHQLLTADVIFKVFFEPCSSLLCTLISCHLVLFGNPQQN